MDTTITIQIFLRRGGIIFLMMLLAITESSAQIFPRTTIWNNVTNTNRINLYVIPDGFTTAEMPLFAAEANKLVEKLKNTSPFKEYINFLRVLRVDVPSVQSGCRHPHSASDCGTMTSIDFKETYFKSSFDIGGIHRLLVPEFSLVQNFLFQNAPDYDMVIMIVNTPVYGGSGGTIATYSLHSSSVDIALHELGHSFADLGDEYTSTGSGCSGEYANVTSFSAPTAAPWAAWVNQTTVPATCGNSSDIGLFKGAGYCSTQYRPKCTCKMRDVKKEYCEVCSEQIVHRIHELTSLLESNSNTSQSYFNLTKDTILTANLLATTNGSVAAHWKLNGVKKAENVTFFNCQSDALLPGSNRLVLYATDNAGFLKIYQKPIDSLVWIIQKASNAVPLPPAPPEYFSASNIKETQATLSWLAPPDVGSFHLQIKKITTTDWGVTFVLGNTNNFITNGLVENSDYEVRLRAIKGGQSSAYVSTNFKTLPAATNGCNTATNLAVADVLPSSATVSWFPIVGLQSYMLKYRALNSSAVTSTIIANTKYTFYFLQPNTDYTASVQALCGNIYGTPVTINFKTKPMEACPDNFEPNNTASAASSLPFNTLVNGLINVTNDEDYYYFSLSNNATNVAITLNNLLLDYDLKLQKLDGTVLAFSAASGKTDEFISKTLAAGTYFIRVYGFSGNFSPQNCYGLRVAVSPVGAVPLENAEAADTEMNISPNPTSGAMQIYFYAEKEAETSVMLTNSFGYVLSDEKKQMRVGDNKLTYDVSHFPDGVYYVRLSNRYRTLTRKLVVTSEQ